MNKSVAHNVYRISASSNDTGINARKNLTAILTQLSRNQARIAEGLGIHESAVSRWKDEQLPKLAKMLALLGLKVVPEQMVALDQRQIDALIHLAQQLNRGEIDAR
jgi:predicted XRE-type DNA-binding protein